METPKFENPDVFIETARELGWSKEKIEILKILRSTSFWRDNDGDDFKELIKEAGASDEEAQAYVTGAIIGGLKEKSEDEDFFGVE